MISIPVGVKIVKFYDAKMDKVGKGILYLLSDGIMFEKKGEGLKFECSFESLASFEAVKKDNLFVVVRTTQGLRSVQFKLNPAHQVKYDIAQVNQEYAENSLPYLGPAEKNCRHGGFDQDAHSQSEARWFEDNWNYIMKFLKSERVAYLTEYVKNAKTGTPDADPYLLVADYENLTYKDFADLSGFLEWRYPSMTNRELEMMAAVFRDFDNFSVSVLEMQVQRASYSKNHARMGRSLYEHVAINSREIAEELRAKNIRS